MRTETHTYDFCVVGGGMAGMLAAISASRHGIKTALIQDRPVLGGNASSEVRMHICGAHGSNTREGGILEEIQLENHYRNPLTNYSIWDSVLHGKAMCQDNLSLFLNCTVHDCEMAGNRICSVTGWQMTTEKTHIVSARLFADCSGDGILAALSGADYRIGREANYEFNEAIGPKVSDAKTMGLSCLLQSREHHTPQDFIPPSWCYHYETRADLKGREIDLRKTNFWWIEVGGDQDSIHDTEALRDELLKITFGVWDFVKNRAPNREQFRNWALDWVGFLPGKRESRRYLGDHILTQNEIEEGGLFKDVVAYGGWTMDDHFPEGFYHQGEGTTHYPAPSPFGIPYRTLYSRNISNLFCAGRNHSATHAAMSATRVMGTTSLMGQAVGTAAAIAVKQTLSPRGIYDFALTELQQTLMDDDCYLPNLTRKLPALSHQGQLVSSKGDPSPLRNGVDRIVKDQDNGWYAQPGDRVSYSFASPVDINGFRIVFDSYFDRVDTNRDFIAKNMRHYYALNADRWTLPSCLTRHFRIEVQDEDGNWQCVYEGRDNHKRLVRIPLVITATGARLIIEKTWGAAPAHLFAFDVF